MSKLIIAKTENIQVCFPDLKTGEICEAIVVLRKVLCIEVLDNQKHSEVIEIREDLLESEI